jgi:phage shock protein A
MAEKRTVLGRIAQSARADINSLLDRAEDPEKMLDRLIRDYANSIAEAQDAVAVSIGNLRLAESDHAADVSAASDWGTKAEIAASSLDTRFEDLETDVATLEVDERLAALKTQDTVA